MGLLGRYGFHGEVDYILAAVVSEEDRLVLCLGGADVPVGELHRLKLHLGFDFYLVEDKPLFHLLLWVLFGIQTLQENRKKNFVCVCDRKNKATTVAMFSGLLGRRVTNRLWD